MTHWTWEYIDEYMTMPRLTELTDAWWPQKKSSPVNPDKNLQDFIQDVVAGGGKILMKDKP